MTEAVRKLQAGAALAVLPERPGAPAAVQRLAAQAGRFHRLPNRRRRLPCAIDGIAQARRALAGQMHPDLVGAPGADGDFQQAHRPQGVLQALGKAHQRYGGHAIGVAFGHGAHAPFAFAITGRHQVFVQGQVNHFFVRWPFAARQSQIGFAGAAVAKLVL